MMRSRQGRMSNGFMTHTATADTTLHTTSARVAVIAAVVGGAALVIDTVTITVVNSSFGVLDDVFFYAGLAALVVTLISLAVHLSGGAHGARRAWWGILTPRHHERSIQREQ